MDANGIFGLGGPALSCVAACAVGAAASVFLALQGVRELGQPRRCVAVTDGVVVGYSPWEHTGQVWLPIVRYAVGGMYFQITGPVFLYYLTTNEEATRLRHSQVPLGRATREALPLGCRVVLGHDGPDARGAGEKGLGDGKHNNLDSSNVSSQGVAESRSFPNPFNNAMERLYPIGSKADVHYDPTDPSDAFVERYCPRPLRIVGPVALAAALGVLGVWAAHYL